MEIDDETDEVLYEFDLNSSTSKCDLFNFSTKDYPFDSEQPSTSIQSIQVKPNAKQWLITLEFNETDSLCRKKNNELLLTDEKETNDDDAKMMEFKVLKSNYLTDTKIKYGVCYLTKSKKVLDVVPIGKVFDFQTDFTYLDNDDGTTTTKSTDLSKDKSTDESLKSSLMRSTDAFETANQTEQPLSPPIELQNFTLRYETSFEYSPWSHVNYVNMKERTTKEPWEQLKLVNKTKDVKNLGRKKAILCDESTNEIANTSANNRHCLLPKQLIDEQATSDLNSISLTKIKQLQLSEKINKLLINCIVIPFPKLVSLIASNLDEELVIKLLQKSAMLVQGCFVIKSDLLFENNLCDMAILHDFISFSFTKSRELKRQEITSQIKFPLDSLMTALNRLARFDAKTRTWHFLYETDHEFIRKHETISVQMEISWEIRKLQMFKNLNLQIEKFREKTSKRKQPPTKKLDDEHKVIKKRLRKRKTKI